MAIGWLRDVLLRDGGLDNLNAIVCVMVETGMRPSEICGLLPDIRLDDDVPHVNVVGGPGRRRLKTPYSEHDLPLVGIALAATGVVVVGGDAARPGARFLRPKNVWPFQLVPVIALAIADRER